MLVGSHFWKKTFNLIFHIFFKMGIILCLVFFSQKTKTFNVWYFILGVDHFCLENFMTYVSFWLWDEGQF
jgi:hypothetical protein